MPTILAPAKVNLFLHVGPPAPDGFHPVCSLMAFADIGDQVRLEPGAFGFRLAGEFGVGLEGEADNLVTRARAALAAQVGGEDEFGLVLDKRLPIAAGLGGGSSDAAAALRLMRDHLGLGLSDDDLRGLASALGSDTPACIDPRPWIAEGRGERLRPPPRFPALPVVLVNPRVASPTGPVYRAYDAAVSPKGADAPHWPKAFPTVAAIADALAACRNDLEAPAMRLNPAIATARDALAEAPETLLARMSGSGATCFALCAEPAAAVDLAARITQEHPGWWVKSGTLGGSR